jgi:DNA mismatch endonuclease (patch repair protein)
MATQADRVLYRQDHFSVADSQEKQLNSPQISTVRCGTVTVKSVRIVSSMDNLSKQERSERMSRIRGVDTGPEMIVRRMVHGMGFRYRLHTRDLPGIPDMVFPRLGKIIFVHGCFWHQHPGCGRQPKSRLDFWSKKLSQNRQRDLRNQQALRSLGWRILIVWECVF